MFKIPIPNFVHHRHLGPATSRQLGKNISRILLVSKEMEVCSQRNLTTIVSSIAPFFRKSFGHLVKKKTASEISIFEQLPIFLSMCEKSCRRMAAYYASSVKGYLSPLNPARYSAARLKACAATTVCMVITYSKCIDQPGKVANPVRGQLNRENEYFPVRVRSRLRIWPRETGSAVPSRVSLLISILRLNLVLTCGIPTDFRGGVHLFI